MTGRPADSDLLNEERERWLVRLLQAGLAGLVVYGLSRGKTGVAVNAAVSLGVTFVPAVLRRDAGISLDVSYVLWISTAVFVHAAGFLGPYRNVPWYDSVAHALSASIVAGAGYATVKAIDRESDRTTLPSELQFAFILVFVMAFRVLWEILEFGTEQLAATLGGKALLVQYGLDDVILDLVFNQVGALAVAAFDVARPERAAEEAAEAVED
ncbi:hypothetical protein M0R88_09820 [Halorussus gelatinilyticus]|uniref:Uncharacterized protein n=1 Tax=Halorussus gelatinilyticus TaxID=2937524 RepID=A0A8U0ICR3_9EURY|nr:hypothetical protein [Halorussus gelatinilyticus]UPV98829.1 hypothetical protein M0R88_09820 [Halorussus gelatinilyticus]